MSKAGESDFVNVALDACVEIELRVEYHHPQAATFDAVWVDPHFTPSLSRRVPHGQTEDVAQALRRLLDASANQVHMFKASSIRSEEHTSELQSLMRI